MESDGEKQNEENSNIQQNQQSHQNDDEYDVVNGGTGGDELSFDATELENIIPSKMMLNVKDSMLLGPLEPEEKKVDDPDK